LIGALNWGLVGVFNYNLVTAVVGDGTTLAKIIFGLVGAAALYEGFKFIQNKGATA
jgi:uncharacterized membrane protein YuzA (DUF378 family)